MKNQLPFAKTLPYWKTSKSGIETWLDKAEKIITEIGGIVNTRIVGRSGDKEGILFGFKIGLDYFKLSWSVLPVKNEKDKTAASRQTATMIYHDTKARCNRIKIFGPRVVFSDWLVLQDGETLAQKSNEGMPKAIQEIKLLN